VGDQNLLKNILKPIEEKTIPYFIRFDKYYRSIRLFRRPLLLGSNLEAIMLEAYRLAEDHYP
jgi:hypothetical protein